jgi:chitin synthase
VHDISWGTKGDNTIATDLGVVQTSSKTKEGEKETVDSTIPTDEKDINAAYDDALHVLNSKPPKAVEKIDERTKQEDYYKAFRTRSAFCFPSGLEGLTKRFVGYCLLGHLQM